MKKFKKYGKKAYHDTGLPQGAAIARFYKTFTWVPKPSQVLFLQYRGRIVRAVVTL